MAEYINGVKLVDLDENGAPITGPLAELEGILREQGATPVERLLSLTDAGEAELPAPSAADPAPGPKGPTQKAVAEALVAIDAAALALSRGRAELTHNGGPDLDEAANELRAAPADVATAVRCVAYARDIRGGREPDDDAPEPPDPKREALEKRARAYEASGRLQQVAYGARSPAKCGPPVSRATVLRAHLRGALDAVTPDGQFTAIAAALGGLDDALEEARSEGAAEARQDVSEGKALANGHGQLAYCAVVGAMHAVHVATRGLEVPMKVDEKTWRGTPDADVIEGLRDHARRLIAALDAWERLAS